MKNRPLRARRVAPLRPAALAVLTFAAVCAAQAQEPMRPLLLAQNARMPSLQDMVVTATRTEQPLSDLVADVSIVDRETIESSGATGLADVLARLPGIEIARNGGLGNATSVYLRGAESRFTAVYIDGVRVDSQSTGGAQWEQIPLSQIERIEVLRGPAAAVYGSDAIGGVIQLFTRKGEGAAMPYVGVGLGNQGTRKLEAGISGVAGADKALDYSLGLAHARSDGFDSKTSGSHNLDRDGYRSTSGHARLGYQINARHKLDATLLASRMDSGYDGFTHKPASPVDDRNLSRLHTAGLNWAARWTEAYSTRVSVTDSSSRYETTPSPYRTETNLRGYLWQNDYRLGAHRFSAALERREDHLNNPALDAWSTTLDRSRSQDALALGYGYQRGGHTLQLNARHDDDSEFGGKGTGSAAYGYAITPQWRATASVGTAFRAPTLYQRFSEYGVPTLRPETSHNAELGLRYAQGRSSFSATVYRNRLSNLILFSGAGPCASTFGCYANVARAQYQGLTLAASHHWAGVQWHGSIDLQNPRDLTTGKQLARRAKRHATFGADTQLAGWTLGAELQASGRRFDSAANTHVLGGYALVNLHASTRVARDYTLLARIDNLGDKAYELARTYATPGRTLYIGLKWAPL
ncbi:TonB-dependent receptor domain-containing protein [Simplicispira lacusdiani]|uniref:TonB-dependent receptor domain-containing protein n=1 Tax=Simplicispira lacusdiani TaxID=2213010 RepID=UPI000E71440E|nr:TonB-dependent receptor [Simplicispira lacusdiani]